MRRTSTSRVEPTQSAQTGSFDLQTSWLASLLLSWMAVAIYIFLEWLFISTRPSFMSLSSWDKRVVILLACILFCGSFFTLFASLLFLASRLVRNQKTRNLLISLLAALTLASAGLLLFDNFTYTFWKFGISTSKGFIRALYALGFLIVFVILDFELARLLSLFQKRFQRLSLKVARALLIAIFASSLVFTIPFLKTPSRTSNVIAQPQGYHNVILVTADGLNANRMSVYGYERQTTPFLETVVSELLLSTNHLPNSGNTSGAITSLLTSKYPSQTRVLYPPDILRGEDSYQHLPAILNSLGFYSAQFSINHYADAKDLNFSEGFDEVNGERMSGGFSFWRALNKRFPENGRLLLLELEDRLTERLKHILFIEPISNSFVQITMRSQDFRDNEKVVDTLDLLQEKEEPVFVHLHWMGTHGSKYYPEHTTFSSHIDRENQKAWDKDLYADSILDFDAGLESLILGIEEIGEGKQTLVVISADHGQGYSAGTRIPLILWSSSGFSQPTPSVNTQSLDVAPTILDYLQIAQPDWMQGQSILDPGYISVPVIGVGTKSVTGRGDLGWSLDASYINAPFYQFDYITISDCSRYYKLNLDELVWNRYTIGGYKTPCEPRLLPEDVRQLVIDHMSENGFIFDKSSIPLAEWD